MNSLALGFLLIALNFECQLAKKIDECDFARELYERHLVPKDEIYKHFCIASTLHTTKDYAGFKGIYGIGSQWWCGEDEVGGNCNVKCSDLLDDDIEDDVKCASMILSQQGLNGWSKSKDACLRAYGNKTEDCLTEVKIMDGLAGALIHELSDTTTVTVRTTTVEGTTLAVTTPTAVPERLIKTNSTESPELLDTPHQKLQEATKCSCAAQNTLLLIIALALCGASATLFLKYRNLKRYVSSSNTEFENHLIT